MSVYLQSTEQIGRLLSEQRRAFDQEGPVSAETRKRRIQAVIDLLVDRHMALTEAMDADFGGRHQGFGLMNDVLGSLASLKHARDHLEGWMPNQPRQMIAPYDQLGASAWVQYQPKGSVGIIGTWNAPLFTLLSPLASAFAAGNRAVLKPSELTAHTAEVLAAAIAERFDPLELAAVTGGVEVSQAFASQPFNHLVFTGSTRVGREIMRRAADNLVPVTLELGGKSPVIVGRSADLAEAARRLAVAKGTNGGQICISPDTVYVPLELKNDFLREFGAAYAALYPRAAGNPDLVAVVNDAHMRRIDGYLADAREQGAEILLCPDVPVEEGRKRPLSIVVNPPRSSLVVREEIFGPALVLLTYTDVQHAVAEINGGERPLALYYFGRDGREQDYVLSHTLSGGVTINDAMMHAALEDAPFGGVGASGMGGYHGREGFVEFSHVRSVFNGAPLDPRAQWGMLPPYHEQFTAGMASMISR